MPDRTPSGRPRTLYEWFARSTDRHPDAPALELDGVSHSYRRLRGYAERLAARIVREHGAVPDRIGLLASRSMVAFAGYLAAQRLGATVTPLNPGYPAARNRTVCSLAGIEVLVAEAPAAARWESAGDDRAPTLLALTDEEATASDGTDHAASLPPYRTTADDVAYVLFTSGSTGRPKGVPIRHRNLSPYLAYNIDRFEVGPGARTSHTFDLTFDPSVHDLFVTWGAGATLVVPQRSELLTPVAYLVERGITHWFSVPSLVSVSAALGNLPTGLVRTLRYGVFIGEQLTYQQADAWRAVATGAVIENVYGPTELTVACTGYRLPAERDRWPATSNDTVPIGPVYGFLDHVVLGEDGREAAEGELCVRGPQRFDGYLDPSDDDSRFLSTGTGTAEIHRGTGGPAAAHYYRTGDRVRRESGTLVHLGRLDNQVKVRGYRVEPGEIEAALRRHPGVLEAVVVAVPRGGDLELVACYTGTPLDRAAAGTWLRERIPAHMVPRRFVRLDALPLNANGKIDRPALLSDQTGRQVPARV